MSIRRIFLRWMFLAVVVLPIWPLIGWGVFGGGGWDFVGLLISMPILFVVLLIVSLIFYARSSVRASRELAWGDIGVLSVWHASIIGFGFFGPTMTWFAVLGVLAGIAALWYGLWQLVRETAARSKAAMAEFERLAQQGGTPGFGQPGGFIPGSGAGSPRGGYRPGDDDDEIIIIEESPRDPK